MVLAFSGTDGTITLMPSPDEPAPDCQVSTSIEAIPGDRPLISITPSNPQPASQPVLVVHALRQPQSDSESVLISGTWTSAGIPSGVCPQGVSEEFKVNVTVTKSTPTVTAVVSGASFRGTGVIPGAIATLFGNTLTPAVGINEAGSLPLPTVIAGTSVLVSGAPVPLLAVASVKGQQQINFQVPSGLAVGATVNISVSNGVTGPPIPVVVSGSQPEVFSYTVEGKAYGAILHGSYQLADVDHPASPGETVLIYCTGLGAVSSAPEDGKPGNGEPTQTVPVATVGGITSSVSFGGLAPGFVGLYQVNVQVPDGVAAGDREVVLTVAGVSSAPVLLPVK